MSLRGAVVPNSHQRRQHRTKEKMESSITCCRTSSSRGKSAQACRLARAIVITLTPFVHRALAIAAFTGDQRHELRLCVAMWLLRSVLPAAALVRCFTEALFLRRVYCLAENGSRA